MLGELSPKPDLFHAALSAQFAGGPGPHVHVVFVEVRRPPQCRVVARRLLFVNVRHVLLPERTVVKPIVAHPAVDHRVHRDRDFQCRMRIHHGHQRQKPVVRDAEDADLSIALRNVFDEPVDRVVGVGRFVDRRRILRPVQRPVHHVVAL